MTRFIFITGGVVSSLGKGLSSAALGALRRSLYDRNLAKLQAALGEAHSFKRRVRVRQPGDGANGTEKGGKKYELKAMWYDFSSGGPRWTAE